MNSWYFLLAVFLLASFYAVYSVGRTVGVLEYEAQHKCEVAE